VILFQTVKEITNCLKSQIQKLLTVYNIYQTNYPTYLPKSKILLATTFFVSKCCFATTSTWMEARTG